MNNTSRSVVCLLVLLFGSGILQVAVGEVLADSGYPMHGANPQRNYQSNRKLLCPEVAGAGRSQVLQNIWSFPAEKYAGPRIIGTEVSIDASGNVYAGFSAGGVDSIVKFNGADGRILGNITVPVISSSSFPTHVEGGRFYTYMDGKTYVVDSTTMTLIGNPIDHGVITDARDLSYAPYKGTHMVSANTVISTDGISEVLTYIKVADKTIDATQFNFMDGSPADVLIYKDAAYEFPIVASNSGTFPNYVTSVISPRYSFNVTETLARAWIEGNTLHMYTSDNSNVNILYFYELNAVTGALLSRSSIDKFQGSTFNLITRIYAVNNVSVTQISDGGSLYRVVDLINDRYLFPQQTNQMQFYGPAIYSKPDNTMLMEVGPLYERIEIIGLDWDTLEVNTRGIYPSDNVFSDIIIGPALIGEDCHVYTTLNNQLFAFAPLPIQNVVPIFECVNDDGVAYFSYQNLEANGFAIPLLSDRNNLSPLNVTPGVDFDANRRGKYFPLSFRVNFGTTGTFTWQLEDYVLTVTLNASLVCPTTVRFKILLAANAPFPGTFSESVRTLFASVMSISDSRVTVVSSTKRSIEQTASELETELQVVPDDGQTELTPEKAVQDFVDQQLNNFNNQLTGLPDAPDGVTTKDVDGVPVTSEILGEKPIPPLVPTAPMASTPTSSPTPTKVASATRMNISVVLFVSSILVAIIV